MTVQGVGLACGDIMQVQNHLSESGSTKDTCLLVERHHDLSGCCVTGLQTGSTLCADATASSSNGKP